MIQLPGWDEVPQDDVIDPGYYQLECLELTKGQSEASGKTNVRGQFVLTENNPSMQGRVHFELFTLGTDEDPTPEVVNPNVFGVKHLIRMFKAMQMPPVADLDEAVVEAIGKRFECRLNVREQHEGEYAGRRNNQIGSFFPTGSKTLGPLEQKGGTGPRTQGRSSTTPTRQARQPYQEPQSNPESTLA